MTWHVSDIHGSGSGHHLYDFHMLHEDYSMHPGRWLLDHPMLPALLLTGLLTILIIGLVSIVYLGMAAGV